LDVERDQGVFVVSDRRRVLPEVAGAEDPAGQLIELLVFNGLQESRADLSAPHDLLKRNARSLSKAGEIQLKFKLPMVWRGCASGVRVHDASPYMT
jgi:hypothetical protein